MEDQKNVGIFRESPPDDWHAYRRYQYLLAKLLFYSGLGFIAYLALSKASGVLSMVFLALLVAYVGGGRSSTGLLSAKRLGDRIGELSALAEETESLSRSSFRPPERFMCERRV